MQLHRPLYAPLIGHRHPPPFVGGLQSDTVDHRLLSQVVMSGYYPAAVPVSSPDSNKARWRQRGNAACSAQGTAAAWPDGWGPASVNSRASNVLTPWQEVEVKGRVFYSLSSFLALLGRSYLKTAKNRARCNNVIQVPAAAAALWAPKDYLIYSRSKNMQNQM